MKCFYHHDIDAVALCKACSRALCPACAADVHPGTACVNRCEADVAALNTIVERSKTAYQKTGQAYKRNAIATMILGALFIVMGVVPILMTGKYGTAVVALLGPVFLLWSYFSYRSGKQIEAPGTNA